MFAKNIFINYDKVIKSVLNLKVIESVDIQPIPYIGIWIAISSTQAILEQEKTVIAGSLTSSNIMAELGKGNFVLPEKNSKSLNINEISDVSPEQFPADLASQISILSLQYPGQNLPVESVRGMKLPPEFVNKILDFLSTPGVSQQMGLDAEKLAQFKGLLQDSLNSGGELRFSTAILKTLQDGFSRLETLGKDFNSADLNRLGIKGLINDFSKLFDQHKIVAQQDILPITNDSRLLFNSRNMADGVAKLDIGLGTVTANHSIIHQSTQTNNYVPRLSVDTMLSQPQWQEAFNSRVLMMAQDQRQVAHIHIKPPELGPIEIRLSMNSEHTHIQFISQHGVVREAIEEAFPKLRDMMNESGVNLGDVNVSDHNQSEFGNEKNPEESSSDVVALQNDDSTMISTKATEILVQKGLVDHYV